MISPQWVCVAVSFILVSLVHSDPSSTPETVNHVRQSSSRRPVQGSLRLHGGRIAGTGNVLVYHGESWGSVCDDGWNLNAAHVVCRMLGYSHALGHTTQGYFGNPEEDIVLDDVQCHGDEDTLDGCRHNNWGESNCDTREAAGVFCSPRDANELAVRSSDTSQDVVHPAETVTTTPTTTTTGSGRAPSVLIQQAELLRRASHLRETHTHNPEPYSIRLVNGRSTNEGRVEIRFDGGRWGTICSDHWTLLEATVACRQAGLGFASMAVQTNSFGGEYKTKLVSGIHCDGEESHLSDCYHEKILADVMCSSSTMVSGAVCSPVLPDLVPNATLLMHSTYLEDRPLIYLQCAMEEGCASSSAYKIKREQYDWQMMRRRLLRFSSSTWNFGTAEFRPFLPKEHWEWHNCHMHYHSMAIFAHYDLLDHHGNQVAEGHKASFCLEDVECLPGRQKKFQCKGFADQGISVGCADNYLHDIDCQWIDVTDVKPGSYIFRVHINPELRVAELSYTNNAATCNLEYTGFHVQVTNCTLGMGA